MIRFAVVSLTAGAMLAGSGERASAEPEPRPGEPPAPSTTSPSGTSDTSGTSGTSGEQPAPRRAAATGWYTEGGLGAVAFLPKASKDANVGPAIDVRVGRDLFSWLSVGITLAASSHEATTPPPPTGEWFQLYRGAAEARIGGRFDRLAVYVEGGAGAAMISSNILGKVMITDPGEHFSIAFHAGAEIQYQLENRHYAVGLGADGFLLPQFDAIRAVDTRLYLRYTY